MKDWIHVPKKTDEKRINYASIAERQDICLKTSPKNLGATATAGSAPQKRSAFPKKQESKKKFNPSQMRQHIWALINENFEEGSEEYTAFVEEVEEKGF